MIMAYELEDVSFLEDVDWDLLDVPSGLADVFDFDNPAVVTPTASPSSTVEDDAPSYPSSSSPDQSLIGEIENILMKDDDFAPGDPTNNDNQEFYDNLFADILADSPPSTDLDSSDKDNVDRSPLTDGPDDPDDPISKKRRRQLRNKDAAVKSRERKKMYVKDLEMKSKYFEEECRRLGRLLQCCYAENHTLRLSLQMNNAYRNGHSVLATGQESAVLLELLLLGSLLWCLDIMCLLALPLALMALLVNPLNYAEPNKALESVGLRLRGAASNLFQHSMLQSLSKSRRCKASRTRMKHSWFPCFLSFALPLF